MEQINFSISRNLPLKRLVAAALGEIERLGYSRRSRNRYRTIWKHLIEFSDRKELGEEFSGDLAVQLLEELRVGDEGTAKPGDITLRRTSVHVRSEPRSAKIGGILC